MAARAEIDLDTLAGMGETALAAMAREVELEPDADERDSCLSWTYALRNSQWIAADWSRLAPGVDPYISETWAFRACVRSLLACALRAMLTGTGRFSCSRSKGWWSRKDRFRDLPYSYDLVMRALAWLVEAGLLDEVRAAPFDHLVTGRQSTYGATELAVSLFPQMEFERVVGFDALRMRNADRQRIAMPDTDETRRMRTEVEEINRWMAGIQVVLPDTLERLGTGHVTYCTDDGIRCYARWDDILRVYRQFCRSSTACGGRLYGDWQSLPGEMRSCEDGQDGMRIVVAGESFATVEPDFEAQHARMSYARLRIKMPDGFDPYRVAGFHRDLGKLAFVIAINSRGWKRTVCAIKRASEERAAKKAKRALREGRPVRPDEMALSFLECVALLKAVRDHNKPIARAFASDAGVGLQHDDSEIMIAVLRRCMAANVPALPVHDSVICREVDEAFVREAMETEMLAYEARFQAAVPMEDSAQEAEVTGLPPQDPDGFRGILVSGLRVLARKTGFSKNLARQGQRPAPREAVPVTPAPAPPPQPCVDLPIRHARTIDEWYRLMDQHEPGVCVRYSPSEPTLAEKLCYEESGGYPDPDSCNPHADELFRKKFGHVPEYGEYNPFCHDRYERDPDVTKTYQYQLQRRNRSRALQPRPVKKRPVRSVSVTARTVSKPARAVPAPVRLVNAVVAPLLASFPGAVLLAA